MCRQPKKVENHCFKGFMRSLDYISSQKKQISFELKPLFWNFFNIQKLIFFQNF